MGFLLFIIILFVFFVGGGWLLGNTIGGFFEKKVDNYNDNERPTYVDNSVHYHVHNDTHEHIAKKITQNNHKHEHKHQNLTVIDEETHRRGLEKFKEGK